VLAQQQVLELVVRGGAVGAFGLLALGIVHGGRTPARLTGALFCLAAAAHTITQSPAILGAVGPAFIPVWALSVMGAGLFWAFASELFGDNADFSPWRLLPAAALLVVGILATAAPPPVSKALWLAQNLIGGALMLHVLFVVWDGWKGDLVETRRRLRGPLLGLAAFYALIVISVQMATIFSHPADQLSMLAAASLLLLSLAGGWVFLRADDQLFGASAARPGPRSVEPQDQPLLARLRDLLEGQEVWREEGLTVGGLAAKVGVPEHYLRRLINERLGYRNFIAFINEHRIGAAKAALGDPRQARTSVSTVAFEVGFGSLGPFNRAFKEATGQTPTAWRRETQAGWAGPERPADPE
jgi:AraC-like DNA-binding protein